MHETMNKAKKLCDLAEKLICQVTPMIDAGVFCKDVDGVGVGQTIDMIKDLYDAEKNIYKAHYYKTVTKAMNESEIGEILEKLEEKGGFEGDGRMGYDNWRYASGRFAPKGSGHYAGYTPRRADQNDPTRSMERDMKDMQGGMGYPRGGRSHMTGRYGYPSDERYGMAYNDYNDAKRHYHESKDPEARKEMEEHAEEHLEDTLETTKDIWKDAKPEKQREFKKHMMELLKDIPG